MREEAMTMVRIQIAVATILVGLIGSGLVGCKSAEGSPGASESEGSESEGGDGVVAPNSAVRKSGGKTVSALFGKPGGTLEIASGAKVEIPPGSITEPMEIVLSETKGTTAFFNEEHERPVGPTFEISPGFEAPEGRSIRVSIPLAGYPEGWGDVSLGYEYPVGERVGAEDSEHTRWQYENAKLSGGRAVADLEAVPGYRFQFVLTNLEAQ